MIFVAVILSVSAATQVFGQYPMHMKSSPGYNDWTKCPCCGANYRWEDLKIHEPQCCNRPTLAQSLGAGYRGTPGSPLCFIATAAYGTPWQKNVVKLRCFRERYLLTTALGRRFVSWYYRTSPPVADYIAGRRWARFTTRLMLTPLVLFAGAMLGDAGDATLSVFGVTALITIVWLLRCFCQRQAALLTSSVGRDG